MRQHKILALCLSLVVLASQPAGATDPAPREWPLQKKVTGVRSQVTEVSACSLATIETEEQS
jgi:hypothetical protein